MKTSATACSRCITSTKRASSSSRRKRENWIISFSTTQIGVSLASDGEAYAGHLGKAQELTKRSVDSAIRADSKEIGAVWEGNGALRQAASATLQKRSGQQQRLYSSLPTIRASRSKPRLCLLWRALQAPI